MLQTLEWTGRSLRLLDQTKLPGETAYIDCTDERMVWDAIKRLAVRGAPAIGVAAAYGAFLSIAFVDESVEALRARLSAACDYLATSRPTAVNLFWALDRLRSLSPFPGTPGEGRGEGSFGASDRSASGQTTEYGSAGASPSTSAAAAFKERVFAECRAIHAEDIDCCRRIGEKGLSLLLQLKQTQPLRILTHCNAGKLAATGIGTALAPIYVAHERGIKVEVFADETRPLLQGARLTAFELSQAGIPVTVLCDNMAASLMSKGKVDAIIVGADRIAANGDTANKIGTLPLAIAAKHFGVPFIVAAPTSTIDRVLPDGTKIPIEHRAAEEVTHFAGTRTAPAGVEAYNPAFDVTPVELISAIVTEEGLWRGSL